MQKKQFYIPSVLRTLETICEQFEDTEERQEQVHKRLKIMGITVDLEETKLQHQKKCFHDDAEILLVADDGMRFLRYQNVWIVGTDETLYLVFRVKKDCIEHISSDGSIQVIKG